MPLCHAPRKVPISEACTGEPFVSGFLHPSDVTIPRSPYLGSWLVRRGIIDRNRICKRCVSVHFRGVIAFRSFPLFPFV